MNKNVHKQVVINTFKKYAETVWCYLKSSNTKGSSYDPYRQTGFSKTNQSPLPVKAIVHPLTPDSRVLKELGVVNTGAIAIIINSQDVNLIKLSERITYDEVEYSPYKKSLGNRVQITKRRFGFHKILIFTTGN